MVGAHQHDVTRHTALAGRGLEGRERSAAGDERRLSVGLPLGIERVNDIGERVGGWGHDREAGIGHHGVEMTEPSHRVGNDGSHGSRVGSVGTVGGTARREFIGTHIHGHRSTPGGQHSLNHGQADASCSTRDQHHAPLETSVVLHRHCSPSLVGIIRPNSPPVNPCAPGPAGTGKGRR